MDNEGQDHPMVFKDLPLTSRKESGRVSAGIMCKLVWVDSSPTWSEAIDPHVVLRAKS